MSILIIFVLLILIALVFAYAMNWLWLRNAGAKTGAASGLPACGKCGYPARGIESLNCPECGADLREVGIQRPNQGKAEVTGCVLPILLTVMILIVGSILRPMIAGQLPTYNQSSFDLHLSPNSRQYTNAMLIFEAIAEQPPGNSNNWIGVSTSTRSNGAASTCQITLTNLLPSTLITRLEFHATPNVSSTTASATARFHVDLTTQHASWSDSQGKRHATVGPYTDQDVLAFLAALGADPNNAEINREADELYAVLDGITKGMNHYSLQGFGASGSSSTSRYLGGPSWFTPSYILFWVLVWIIGLIWIIRRGRAKLLNEPEQISKKY